MHGPAWLGSRFARYAGAGQEVEALQTDVMRFVAILGLCLLAVFALVQSIPLSPASAERLARAEALAAERDALAARLEAAEGEAQRLRARLASVEGDLSDARTALKAARDETAGLRVGLRQAQVQRDAARAAEASARQAVQEARARAREAREASERTQRALAAARRRLAALEAPGLPAEPTPVREAAAEREPTPAGGRADSSPAPDEGPVEAPRQGFVLQFASPAALRDLVARETVALYARRGDAFWRLRMDPAGERLEPSEAPAAYHRMEPDTVPRDMLAALGGAALAPETVTWGVSLPAGTRASIRSLMRGSDGGRLVITASGRVRLED
jgi:hypothetical protein